MGGGEYRHFFFPLQALVAVRKENSGRRHLIMKQQKIPADFYILAAYS